MTGFFEPNRNHLHYPSRKLGTSCASSPTVDDCLLSIPPFVSLTRSDCGVLNVIEGDAENTPKVTIQRDTVIADGGVGLHEAFHSHMETRRISCCKLELGSVILYILVSDVIMLYKCHLTWRILQSNLEVSQVTSEP